jgi:SAM-dependent methyltransferase
VNLQVWKFNWLANHKIVAALERARPHARGRLLDVGCGSMPFAGVFEGHVDRYLGVDPVRAARAGAAPPAALARGEALPFRAGSFDTVLGISMLNRFSEPLRMLQESHRVLKPGGTLILEFEQMAPVYEPPHDYWRFTRYGAAWLLDRAGFETLDVIPIGGLMARVGLSMIGGLNRLNRGPLRVLTELPVRLLYVVIQIVFELLDRVFLSPGEVLAHLVVTRRRSTPADS